MQATANLNLISYLIESIQSNTIDDEFESICLTVKKIIQSEKNLSSQLDYGFRKNLFDFRIKILNERKEIFNDIGNYTRILSEIIHTNPEYEILQENYEYSLSCYNEFIISYSDKIQNHINADGNEINTSYQNLIDAFDELVPTEHLTKQLEFIDCSLILEFCWIAVILIVMDRIKISESKLLELEFLLVDTSQNFLVYLSLLKSESFNENIQDNEIYSDQEILEQRTIADEGFSDWAKKLDDEF